jgi:predicted phosphodiesterase
VIRILHLSDLHIRRATLPDQEVVIKAAIDDIRARHSEHPVDLVVFSGDLTFSAQPDEFTLAEQHFLDPLLQTLELDRSRIVLGPGNHDIDRTLISKIHEIGLGVELTSRDSANALLDDSLELERAVERTKPWNTFVDTFYSGVDGFTRNSVLSTSHRSTVDGFSIAMASVHSAWRATGASENADRAKLIVGDRQVLQAVAACEGADVRGVAMHHPSSWLTEWDAQDVQRELHQFHLLFTGHTHVSQPQEIRVTAGSYLSSAAGSLYGSRTWINSFNIIDLDPQDLSGTIHFRSYFDNRRAFATGVDIANDGVMAFALAERGSDLVVAQASVERPKICREALLRAAHARTAVGFDEPTSDRIENVLVTPVLTSVPAAQWNSLRDPLDPSLPPTVNAVDRLASERVLVVVGDAESGVTTTLEWIAVNYSSAFPEVIPLRISGSAITKSPTSLDRAIRVALTAASSALPEHDSIPACVVAVDDIDARLPRSRPILKALSRSILGSPDNVYVLGARPTHLEDLTRTLAEEGITVTTCHIGRWGRKQLREMASIVDSDAAETIVRQVTNMALGEGVGGRPYMLTSLIHVVSEDPTFSALSDPTFVTERHVGLLLGRDTMNDSRWTLDYRNAEGVLGALAEHFLNKGTPVLARNEVESLLSTYFLTRMWEESASRSVDALIKARVLRQSDNQISFAQPAFLGLFAAKRYFDDSEFAESLRRDALRRPEIIRHVAALNRNDRTLLARASEVLEGLSSDRAPGTLFSEAVRTGQWDASESHLELAAAPEVDSDTSDDLLDRLWDAMESVMLIDPTKPLELDSLPPALTQTISLTLVSAILKHSELIDDADAKTRMLEEALGHWADSIILIGSDERIIGFATDLLEGQSSSDGIEQIVAGMEKPGPKQLKLLLENFPPLIVSAQMEYALASRKLGGVISALLQSRNVTDDPGKAMMLAILGMQTRHQGWAKVFRDVMVKHGSRPLIGRAMSLLALMSYDAPAVFPADRAYLDDGLAEVYLSANGLKDPSSRSRRKGEFMTGLRKRFAQADGPGTKGELEQ